jgi:hypothetical protein
MLNVIVDPLEGLGNGAEIMRSGEVVAI